MTKHQFFFILLILILILGLFIYYYVFNIYEVTYSVHPKNLFADYKSQVTIKTIPLNALGFQAPLRHSYTSYTIEQGKDLIDVITQNNKTGLLILQAKDKTGTIVVHLKSEFALLPTSITINIYPNYTLSTK